MHGWRTVNKQSLKHSHGLPNHSNGWINYLNFQTDVTILQTGTNVLRTYMQTFQKIFIECFESIFLWRLMDNEQFTHSYRLLVSVLPFMVTFVIGICCLIKITFSSLFCWKLYEYSREKLHVNYVWEFKGWTVWCDTLPPKFHSSSKYHGH